METHLLVYNTSAPNRKNIAFSVGALEDALALGYESGVPSCIGHDMLRPIAWSVPSALYLEPGLTSLTGLHHLPGGPEDQETIARLVKEAGVRRFERDAEPHLSELKEQISEHLDGSERACLTNGLSLVSSGLAARVLPELFRSRDPRHALVPLKTLTAVAPGVFEHKGLLIFAHHYFRRSLSRHNTLNDDFLALLQATCNNTELDVTIALDPDQVGLASSRTGDKIELEYWWGPKFSDSLGAIAFGVTRHEASDTDRLFCGIDRTEFWWHPHDGARWFECEEILEHASRGIEQERFGCRYAHSILQSDGDVAVHLDGAVRVYDGDKMIRRWDTDISNYGKDSAEYVKLWRIDGPLSVSKWKALLSHHFRGNRLVGEYFDGEDPNAISAPALVESPGAEAPLHQYVPADMRPGDGVRIAVTYSTHENGHVEGDARRVVARSTLTRIESGTAHYMEEDTLQVWKAIVRRGGNLALPRCSEVLRIHFHDLVLNLPVFVHSGPNAAGLAEDTLGAISEALLQGAEAELDRLLSFSIAILFPERMVTFSFAGHVADLAPWLHDHHPPLPHSALDVRDWLTTVHTSLSDIHVPKDSIRLRGLLQKSGQLVFERRFLESERCKLRVNDTTGALEGEIRLSEDEQELRTLLKASRIEVAIAMHIKASKCSSCNGEYSTCHCMTADGHGGRTVECAEPVALFLTNRKA